MYRNARSHRHLFAIQLDRPIYDWRCLLRNWKRLEPLHFREVHNCKRNTSHDFFFAVALRPNAGHDLILKVF